MSSNLSPFGRSKLEKSNSEMRFSSPDKDVMISQLKNQVFEFEQNEKNFSSLQAKYRGMQNDFSLVSEEKIRLEYELKQRTELLNKQIAELRNDNDNLQSNLNEKLALNKRLYNDNNNLFRTLESRNAEIEALREQLADCDDSNSILKEEKSHLEKTLINLTDVKKSNEVTINKYLNEIDSCNKICEEQDGLIKNLNDEKSDLLGRIDELNFELKNTFGKLKSKEDALSFVQRQFEDSSKNISKLEIQLRELEQNLGRTKIELNNSNNSQSKERALRIESEKNGEKLEMIIKERTNEIKRLSNDLDGLRIMIEKLNSEKGRLLGEIERYKSHIVILTEQNQRITEELDVISEKDERIWQQLNRKERLTSLVNKNKNFLEVSLTNLDEYLNKSTRALSPSYQRNLNI